MECKGNGMLYFLRIIPDVLDLRSGLPEGMDNRCRYVELLLPILVQESRRWQTLEIDIPNNTCHLILSAAWKTVPLLEKLRVRLVEDCEFDDQLYSIPPLATLTHLSLNTEYDDVRSVPDSTHYPNLSSLFLCRISDGAFVSFLTNTSQTLRHLHLEDVFQFQVSRLLRS